MKDKILFLSALFLLNVLMGFSQNNERILGRSTSNLKAPSEKAVPAYDKGVDHAGKKEYSLAVPNYELAIAIDSDYIDAYNNLGLAFFELGSLDSAAYYLQISLHKLPTGTTALQNLALVEEKKDNLPKALGYYKQIAVIEPESPEGYYNSGRVLATMAKFDEALAQALRAEKLYAKSNSPYTSDCLYLIFAIYYNMQNKPMAKKYMALCKKENVSIPADMESALQ